MMASRSNTIIIADDEELPNLQPGGSRPRRAPRHNYNHEDSESMFIDAADDETRSRKRKRTEKKKPSALDNAFQLLNKEVRHEVKRLKKENRMRQDELRQEKERYQKAQADLSRERERRVLECKICYMQPDHWVTILCGHMVCESCAEKLEIPKSCPICRAPSTGHIKCLPFAG
ncbi:hypothetical protein N7497_001549 [Penicillium chrysogenum]|uniref:RING-type domain-containing protein n=1 Tax=Penicillium chrysogenum TaxID=5076 RepID=A0ABQ8W5A9_PENCH|nr:hypothetical protein N7505_010990 [Penicillium chrysogenum]KAJ6168706.1 hypothetical protein N7497_001549 [Penicillium chrysogenum]